MIYYIAFLLQAKTHYLYSIFQFILIDVYIVYIRTQVFIENIHIRYEDRVTNPDHPFACGLILKQLSAETTNEKWQVTQIDANSSTIHKVGQSQNNNIHF